MLRKTQVREGSEMPARQLQEQGAIVNGKPNPWLVSKEKAHREMVALSLRLRLSPQGRAQHAPKAPEQRGRGSRIPDMA
jgi:phage terminase small subunit